VRNGKKVILSIGLRSHFTLIIALTKGVSYEQKE
jgi:hypothetical protein